MVVWKEPGDIGDGIGAGILYVQNSTINNYVSHCALIKNNLNPELKFILKFLRNWYKFRLNWQNKYHKSSTRRDGLICSQ